jgi:Protein of unknown function (DUF2934)
MRPTPEQIAITAYHRWQRRDHVHGNHEDDWVAAEKDLTFGMNYRYVARYPLIGPSVRLGQGETLGKGRRCRFCEQAAPVARFTREPLALPAVVGNTALYGWDECDDCREQFEAHLAVPFDTFARSWIGDERGGATLSVAAWKGLVRQGLSIVPAAELHYFVDTIEWVANADHVRDASLWDGLGCHVYSTAAPIATPFAALARRIDDESPWPYMILFLGVGRAVFQTHLPFCPPDEELEDSVIRGPELSMSLGAGPSHRASVCTFLPVSVPGVGDVPLPRAEGPPAAVARARG